MNSDNLSIYSISTLDGKSSLGRKQKPYFFTLFMACNLVVFRFFFGVAVYATKYRDYTISKFF